jgi:hypothetical protein
VFKSFTGLPTARGFGGRGGTGEWPPTQVWTITSFLDAIILHSEIIGRFDNTNLSDKIRLNIFFGESKKSFLNQIFFAYFSFNSSVNINFRFNLPSLMHRNSL